MKKTSTEKSVQQQTIAAIVASDHADVFSWLGMHSAAVGNSLLVRAFVPDARAVEVVDAKSGALVAALEQIHPHGVFEGGMGQRRAPTSRAWGLPTCS